MDNNRNFILAIVLSMAVLFGWQYFYAIPKMEAEQAKQAEIDKKAKKQTADAHAAPTAPAGAPSVHGTPKTMSRAKALNQGGARVAIQTPTVSGSLRLQGARFDDLRLKKYRESVEPNSKEIELLSPSGSPYPYFAQVGWTAADGRTALPDEKTPWTQVGGGALTPDHPVTLQWDNGQGLVFTRKITVDDQYMFTIVDSVANTGKTKAALFPYALVVRDGVPSDQNYWVFHEGFVGVAGEKLQDPTYKDFKDDDAKPETFASTGGWVGITDKYWMAALVPPQAEKYDGTFRASPFGDKRSYQANYTLGAREIAAGATVSVTHKLFAGAKVVDTLRTYQHRDGIVMFDYAVDWGWFSPITRPMFWLLDTLNKYLGNFGLAIILATVLIRLLLYPLANASFKSMIKMKQVQPEMERIKKVCGEDKQKLQQEMMELYKREKVNPVSGCLPLLVQIPILFSLYKVMFVTIEMYHAPFYGWIRDLSAGDPTTYINLFGLLPFTVPHDVPFIGFLLNVGIWPVLMGITQWVQTKMNPAPADPVQAKMFALMPWIFMFMMATFPAGLVIYWTWNNALSVAQQYVMMRRAKVEIHLFNNLKLAGLVKRLGGTKDAK